MTHSDYPWVLLAITLWREARGCSDDEKRAVAHVIANRAADPAHRWGKNLVEVLTQYEQFTSISPPRTPATTLAEWMNATTWPRVEDPNWIACCAIADEFGSAADGVDPTKGATCYYSVPIVQVPKWADVTKQTLEMGPFRFFKL